jgi:hypothetical protein
MTMQASTLGILEDADFSPKQARALAQAIEGEIKGEMKGSDLLTVTIFEARFDARLDARLDARNFVTTPVLEAQMAEVRLAFSGVRLEMSQMENRLINKMVAFGLSMAGLIVTAVYFLVLNAKR